MTNDEGDAPGLDPGRPLVASGDTKPAIALSGITKRFPGVVANRDVNLRVDAGSIHALIGENGAGKSTLMKTLYGMHQPDEGTIEVDGAPRRFRTPADAIAAGIGMVHQHFMLADQLTVAENIVLGAEPASFGVLDRHAADQAIVELGERHGLPLDPHRLVESLTVGERQRLEILKVLFRGARILILDEPTAVLIPQEVTELFTNLEALRAGGVTIVFISHKLDEVMAISDAITVMRAGTTVATVNPANVDAQELGRLMVGSELPTPTGEAHTPGTDLALRTTGLRLVADGGRVLLDDINLEVHRSEIVGIAGVEGNGQQELIDALLGLTPADSGTIELGSRNLEGASTRERRDAGMGYIPTDRHREGLLLGEPLWANQMLGHQGARYSTHGWLRRRAARADTERVVSDYDVRTPGVDIPALALSGGNQQKLIVGREMTADPTMLIAAHPTRGVDVGAQAAIWEQLRQARRDGLAVLLISADLDELIGLSDRLLVIFRGAITANLDPTDITAEDLGSYMAGRRQEATL
ncbi:MAG: ABC transporter ATP-binding protein [Microthrixaceae bacterium]